ncbi:MULTISPECIES: class I SAM-dependent methyltransferase [unclassified Mesorhizobium]|uniref:class I SAM-dependent methyltransferase n=1 Tax=unclassified Mesorhizobium TaxID=325217 RepID=UPI001CCAE4C4|nr:MULTISPECIES: rRNA adenine N-6-methyltransferase family protein [unclassified Mesorhizobium]MBZ9680831.1 phospholipid methyltransferase [Mesorhizobium sp. CO1-1-2]MBZ9924309.1 phospholipid methyltransferase [Mesorhizobium sp. BR1-1-4]
MTRDIGPETGPVLELGPGTGPFTRALLSRGVKEEDLTLIESDPDFAALLMRRFPAARIFEMDAVGLRHLSLFPPACDWHRRQRLAFPADFAAQDICHSRRCFRNLRPGGALYQFTLGRRCPFDQSLLDRLDLGVTRVGHTFRNFPPATVYRIARLNTSGTYDWRFA